MSSLRQAYGRVTSKDHPEEISPLLRSATLDGSPDGDANAAVDGSVTPVEYYIQPPMYQEFEVVQGGIEISDSGNPGIDDYGSIVGPLLNGIQFFIVRDGVEIPFGNPFKSNRELINLGPVISRTEFSGNTYVSTYTFNLWEHARNGVFLDGNSNDRFGFRVRDNLSTLINHSVVAKGNIRIHSVP